MGHIARDRKKIEARIRRIQGQLDAVVRALDDDTSCADVLMLIASARGAVNGLMGEVVEEHVRMHVLDPKRGAATPQAKAADELVGVIKRYLT